jgi:hypothetical protein
LNEKLNDPLCGCVAVSKDLVWAFAISVSETIGADSKSTAR